MLPTLRQLQFFQSLVRNRSFGRAAVDCAVSQSTLSAGIKELETILGAQLVDRSSRQFQLTPLGETVADRGEEILNLAQDLMRVAEARPLLSGDLRLGLIPTIGPYLLTDMLPPLKRDYPALRLFLREDLTEGLLSSLKAGDIDIAVLAMPVEVEGFDTLIFAEDPFLFACAQDHPLAGRKTLSPQELSDQRLLLLEDGHCLRDHALDACELRSRDTVDTFGATSLFTLTQMVAGGLGTTLLPKIAVDHGLAAFSGLAAVPIVEAAGTVPSRDLGLAWRRNSGREADARALADMMAELLPMRG
ncbi:transcriptional regulator, LysR family protein [Parvularcula bermudensis HTCC2503]|uniref:Transcriptional regulator, LysR family protein n=1 Tax=Parvularcula bermudensis (strain ATCC BAA-594 / HTCC2503 / KCTC 12087) TaxID=314260 RepID=E0THM3_PARBH|nr:hydrogen peroxide-inducible genes activator [Parvularcula bermudensis]ADM09319.1 transcriptional regulator, LysR family protein [Parvularcula bermudensis HTCC2503]